MLYAKRCGGRLRKAVRPLRTSWHNLGAKVNSKVHPLSSTSAIKINPINFHYNWILIQLCHSSQLLLERGHIKSLHLISAPNFTQHQSTWSGSERLNRLVRFCKVVQKSWRTLLWIYLAAHRRCVPFPCWLYMQQIRYTKCSGFIKK